MPRPFHVALVVLAIYVMWLVAWLHAGHQSRDFVLVGRRFISASNVSQAIQKGPVQATSPTGFDGQFYYYIALDPLRAAPYIDSPSYRYQRIVYPLAARAVVLGHQELVPAGLIAINLAAIVAGTVALAGWLVRREVSPWAAAVWGLHPGQVFSIETDLADPSAYGLAAIALWVRDRWPLAGGAVFGVAGLTRETTLIFPAILLLADLIAQRGEQQLWLRVRAGAAAVLALAPLMIWKLFLWQWLARPDEPFSNSFTLIPFGGLIQGLGAPELLPGVAIPTLISLAMAGWAVWHRRWGVEVALLIVNALLLVVFTQYNVYVWWPSALRTGLGAVLATVLLLAIVPQRSWFWFTAGLWFWFTATFLLRWI